MNNKILFMIINNQVMYLQNTEMDHREWYTSLNLDLNLFESVIRGYVMDGKIVFFKGSTFSYDADVMKAAKIYGPTIRLAVNNQTLPVCCGILIAHYGAKWEPIVVLNEDELTGFVQEKVEVKKEVEPKQLEAMIDFKNDYTSEKYIKTAVIVTGITLVLSIIVKISMIISQKMYLSNGGDVIISFVQIGLLGGTIFTLMKKKDYSKYLGIAAGISLFLMFDLPDIILGILYSLFSIDMTYFTKGITLVKDLINKNKN